MAVSVACMAILWPTPSFKGRTFKLCVLTRWDFNFSVRSSPLREPTNVILVSFSCHPRLDACKSLAVKTTVMIVMMIMTMMMITMMTQLDPNP